MTDGPSEVARQSRQTLMMPAIAPTQPMEAVKSCAWPHCKEPNGGRMEDGTLLRDPYCCGEHAREHEAELEPTDRPTWPETWMAVARTMAMRSYDPRLQVGAIVVSCDNTQMLSVGYNGNYKGGPHVHESPEPGKSGFIHAEVNALVKCDFNFAKKKHMYVTHMPCKDCAKLIINAEIARVVWEVPYRLTEGVDLLRKVGVEVFDLETAVRRARYESRRGPYPR